MAHAIKTKYYVGRRYSDPIKINSATNANQAVATAVLHMQIAQYRDANGNPATSCEVFDNDSGMLHAIVTRSAMGMITIMYKRDPLEFDTPRLALGAIVGKQIRKNSSKGNK